MNKKTATKEYDVAELESSAAEPSKLLKGLLSESMYTYTPKTNQGMASCATESDAYVYTTERTIEIENLEIEEFEIEKSQTFQNEDMTRTPIHPELIHAKREKLKPEVTSDEEITIKEIFYILNRGAVTIFTATLVFGLIGVMLAGAYFLLFPPNSAGNVQAMVSFNHQGAEQGLDPAGNLLEVTVERFRSPEVLARAIEEQNLAHRGVTVEHLRENMAIRGLVPRDAMSRIVTYRAIAVDDPNMLENLLHVEYLATQFALSLSIPQELSFLVGRDAENLLQSIINAYRQIFYEEFLERNVLHSPIATLSYAYYHDFFEALQMLDMQINSMRTFVSSQAQAAPNFRALSTGFSFGDIWYNLELLANIDMSSIRAFVNVRHLTRDPDLRLLTYQLTVEELQLSERVQREYAEVLHYAIANYERETIAWFGSIGPSEAHWDFRHSEGIYQTLIERVVAAERNAIQLRAEIDAYQRRIASLQQTSNMSVARRSEMAILDEMIADLIERLNSWIDIINETTEEFLTVGAMSDFITTAVPPQFASFSGRFRLMALIVLATTFGGFGLSVVYVFLKNMFVKK